MEPVFFPKGDTGIQVLYLVKAPDGTVEFGPASIRECLVRMRELRNTYGKLYRLVRI